MFTRRTTAKVSSRENNARAIKLGIIQWMVGFFTSCGIHFHIIEHTLRQIVKGDALHEAGGNNTIRVDIYTRDRDSSSRNLSNDRKGHLVEGLNAK